MATGSVLTIIFALVAGGLLVFGYMHEEKVIEFEDRLARHIARAIVSSRKVRGAERTDSTASVRPASLTIKRRRAASAGSDSGRAA